MSSDKITGHCVCKRYTVTIPRSKEMNLCRECTCRTSRRLVSEVKLGELALISDCVDCRRWAGSMCVNR